MHGHGGYDSDFSDDEHCGKSSKRKKRTVEDDLLLKKPFQKEKHGKVAHKQVAAELLDKEEARNRRFHLIAMDAYQRHTKFINDYILYYGGKKEDFRRLGENDKTDMDVIRENHRFLWNEEDEMDMNWERRLAKKYYDKLFKEYCIADLSRYKENKFGFRWRIEKEVISGKGEKKSSQKKERIKPKKTVKSHHIKSPDYLLQKRALRKKIKEALMRKKVLWNLNFGRAHYQKQMKNHRKKNLMIIFKIYFCRWKTGAYIL
ncbi:protein FRA10AC1 isoform X5 [Manis javanica]|uniref:protein FRA10AC1 isoform X5 n=1 Tax=Manis javanica TaxID=9974 RepID=UPI00187B00B8|nr:protein FRA10AC1 isoform X8 [Manis javanica]